MVNIAKIIKNFPEDYEYYNTLTGVCKVKIIEDDNILILPGDIKLNKYGQYSPSGDTPLLFPKENQRDWESFYINSGGRIDVFSRLLSFNLKNKTFCYGNGVECKVRLNHKHHTIEIYRSDSSPLDILNYFGCDDSGDIFLKPSKHSSYLDWFTIPKELPLGTLVVASNNKKFWSIGTYEGNQCVTTTFPKRINARYQYIVPYSSFNLETGEFPESENYGCAKGLE